MFAKFAYEPGDVGRVEVDVEPALAVVGLLAAPVRRPRRNTRGVQPNLRLQQVFRLGGAIVLTLAGGTIGFHETLRGDRGFRRSIAPSSRRPSPGSTRCRPNDGARIVSIVLVLAGLTIIAYAGAVIVEAIAGGVLTGVLAERRRERTIERLNDHFIICGYGRVGRQVAEEFRAAGVPLRRARLPRGRDRRPRRSTATC